MSIAYYSASNGTKNLPMPRDPLARAQETASRVARLAAAFHRAAEYDAVF
jgi:hypothetical protein